MHTPRDAIVGIDIASKIFLAAQHPKSFVSLDDADHLLSDAAGVIAAWAGKYIPAAADEIDIVDHVNVRETGQGKFQNIATA